VLAELSILPSIVALFALTRACWRPLIIPKMLAASPSSANTLHED
jgi:hypothetical protein